MLVLGVDEVGRGAGAGPVVAAAVIWEQESAQNVTNLGGWTKRLTDSKCLSSTTRYALEKDIKRSALAWGIGVVGEKVIEEINILQASLKAMDVACSNALDDCSDIATYRQLDSIVVDGLFIPLGLSEYPHCQAVVKADLSYPAVSAASILAKCWRDSRMVELAEIYPEYHFANNKGYLTEVHRNALQKHGPSPVHRLSFKGVAQGCIKGV